MKYFFLTKNWVARFEWFMFRRFCKRIGKKFNHNIDPYFAIASELNYPRAYIKTLILGVIYREGK